MNNCQRCKKETTEFTMSMFNTEICCMKCIEEEKKHPNYKKAYETERQHVLEGNYNFEGIGLPDELNPNK